MGPAAQSIDVEKCESWVSTDGQRISGWMPLPSVRPHPFTGALHRMCPLRRRHPLTPGPNLRALLHMQEPLALLGRQGVRDMRSGARHQIDLNRLAGYNRCTD